MMAQFPCLNINCEHYSLVKSPLPHIFLTPLKQLKYMFVSVPAILLLFMSVFFPFKLRSRHITDASLL